MKRDFHGFYKPNDGEFDALWNDAIIVVDANVLLNLYTYSQPTAEEILSLLGEFGERIWLPHQVAAEYHTNRCAIILKESKRYAEIAKALEAVGEALRARKRHPYVTPELAQKFDQVEGEIKKELEDGERKHRELISADSIRDTVTELFDGRVGAATKEEKLEEIHKEGSNRYAKKIPPGYSDVKKPEPDRYGDLVLWHQLIEHATTCKQSVIFVTDDLKEDWWAFAGDNRLGPRPELRHEFRGKTGHDIYIYSTDAFVDTANTRGKKLSETAAKEIENASKERQKDAAISRARELLSRMEEHRKLREAMERLTHDPLKDIRKQQEMLERLSSDQLEDNRKLAEAMVRLIRDPLKDIRKQQEMLERLSSDQLEDNRKLAEAMVRLIRDPRKDIRKQQEMLERLSRGPLEEYRQVQGALGESKSENDDTDTNPR